MVAAGRKPDEPGSRERWCFHDQIPSASDPVCCTYIVSLERNRRTFASRNWYASCSLRQGGLIAAVGSGEGILTFHGKHDAFLVAGASIGTTLAASTSVLRGTALNISTPSDLAGTYTGVGGGAAVNG
jgi:hypothetical protein